ncbi:MAG: TVP38/TMEM64 family protein [Symploca sp. SIO1C4]|uniref:TVP38/TMEM64 family membrane protein n=1 Tax=Symploca sp. SIO1C4 TaxID=2607765 RepID=A0A6B3NEL0_9CYAN|nr:TVP38/TMEM64 family protein [Symploca sp. SIO1C4]
MKRQNRASRKIKRLFYFFLVAISVALLIIVQAKYFNVQKLLTNALVWVESLGSWAPVAFIVIYNLATVLFVPGALLTLGGGVIFGMIWGFIYVFIASTLGAIFAFLIGRYLSRHWVAKKIEGNTKFQAIDQSVAKEGFKIVLLTRLAPVFPFNLLNYAFGVTRVSFKDYCLGSVGMIPGTFMYVYLGSVVGDLAMITTANQSANPQAQTAQFIIHVLGAILTVAVTVYIARAAQKVLENG